MKLEGNLNLQGKIMLLVIGVVVGALVLTNILISNSIDHEIKNGIGRQASSVAHLIARSPLVVEGLDTGARLDELQAYANASAEAAGVEFIVVLDMQGIRKSHPEPERLGKRFVGGDEADALHGLEYVSIARGTLGDSLRAFVPVFTPDGRQVGVVVVGILMNYVKIIIKEVNHAMLTVTIVGILLGTAGAYILACNIKQTLFGLEPEVIAKKLEERSAMLHSVHEGIIAVDAKGVITLVNDEAMRMLSHSGLQEKPIGKAVQDCVPNTRLLEVIAAGEAELNQEQDFHGLPVLTNRLPMKVNGKIVGAISTFRDKSEVKLLAEELTGVKDYVDALRAQAHEFMNKLHVILGLVKLEHYQQLSVYINRIVSEHEAKVSFVAKRIREPVLAGFILGKLSLAKERQVIMQLAEESYVPAPEGPDIVHELVTVIGNLLENAFEAVQTSSTKEIELHTYWDKDILYIHVSDSGAGISSQVRENLFAKGVSTKGKHRGYGLYLVMEALERLQGTIEFESRPGEGTVFTVAVPYTTKEEQHD